MDAVISAFAERFVAIAEEQITYQVNLVRNVKKKLRDLKIKLEKIKDVLDDAEKKGVKDELVKKWLRKLENTAYQMEDILDEWHYALVNPGAMQKEKVCCSFIPSPSSCLCFKKLGDRHNIGTKIQKAKAAFEEVWKDGDRFNFLTSRSPSDVAPKPSRVQSTSSIELTKVHGADIHKNKNELVRRLMDNGDREPLSIVGMGGIGKTTLAQLVYNDTQVEDSFVPRIWICVSIPFDVEGIARGIVNSVGKQTIPQGTDQLQLVLQKLRDSISGKKFLLVLDDVGRVDYDEWEHLKPILDDGAEGSKILVTTRNKSVAETMGSLDHQIYYPQHLSDEECWSLLRRISLRGRSEEECGEFEDVGKKIASKCEGLPLAAKVLGSLLQLKKTWKEWDDVFKSEIWQLEEAKLKLFPHLVLSYNELSPTVKRCFSYCAAYPKDSQIKPERLIEEWMALGYLGSVSGNGSAEGNGRDYLNKLELHSLLQDFMRRRDGSIKGCKMHDIVHDFAKFLRENDMTEVECEVCGSRLVSQVQKYRSLVWGRELPTRVCDCLTSVRVLRFECGLPQGMEKLIHLRLLDIYRTSLSEEDLKIICRLYFLQTLLLSECSFEKIPIEIGNLVRLRHLGLDKNPELKELPDEIGNLDQLQKLDLDFCRNLQRLPEGIHRLKNLQHLHIWRTPASRCDLPLGLGELSDLLTLTPCNKLGLLKKLECLRKLYLEFISSTRVLEELVKDAREAELRSKIHIHTLHIEFKEDEVERSPSSSSSSSLWMDVMEALEPNQQNLNKLEIKGYMGSRLPQWISSPLGSVKEIYLYNCYELSSLPPFGKLPFLEFLRMVKMKELKFVGREFLGIESSSFSSSSSTYNDVVVAAFPKLKQLTIKDFPKWLEWEDITVEEEESILVSLMPCLEKLEIKSCKGLKKLPHRLLRKASSTLRILKIVKSPALKSQYRDKDGSEWRSISQNNPHLQLL